MVQYFHITLFLFLSPGGSGSKESTCNAGDLGSIPGSGRSSGEGNGNTLQYSCLENPTDIGVWWDTVHGVARSQTGLCNYHFHFPCIRSIYKNEVFSIYQQQIGKMKSIKVAFIIAVKTNKLE